MILGPGETFTPFHNYVQQGNTTFLAEVYRSDSNSSITCNLKRDGAYSQWFGIGALTVSPQSL